jgi:hypothetical protein
MNLRKVWLLVTAGLFVAWMTYLIVLAATHRHTVVLSRPQFLVSQLDVIAHFDSADELEKSDHMKVKEVRFPVPEKSDLAMQELQVVNLSSCSESWDGPGDYILPLEQFHGKYRVVPVALSNGQEPRIYRLTPDTDTQLKQMPKAP